jgi:hypothetical protein
LPWRCQSDASRVAARSSKSVALAEHLDVGRRALFEFCYLTVGRKRGGYVFHNTRHTAVTNLVNAGVPAHEAMAVSGHQTRSVFDRYSLTLKAQTRAALERVTAYAAAHAAAPVIVPLERARRRQRAVATDTLTDNPREERAKIRRRRTAKGVES